MDPYKKRIHITGREKSLSLKQLLQFHNRKIITENRINQPLTILAFQVNSKVIYDEISKRPNL